MSAVAGNELRDLLHMVEGIAKPFESLHRVGADGLIYPYHDVSGFPTIGWGRLLSMEKWASLDRWSPITRKLADLFYEEDVTTHLREALRLIKVPLSLPQLAALTDFAYNCGVPNLKSSTLLKLVNREENYAAADEFPKWNKSAGVILRGLTRRRLAEREMYLSGTS